MTARISLNTTPLYRNLPECTVDCYIEEDNDEDGEESRDGCYSLDDLY